MLNGHSTWSLGQQRSSTNQHHVALDPRVLIKARSLDEKSRMIQQLARESNVALEALVREELGPISSHACTDESCFNRKAFPDLGHCCHDVNCKQHHLRRPSPIRFAIDRANKLRAFETHLATLQSALYPSVYIYYAGMKRKFEVAREAESGFRDGPLMDRLIADELHKIAVNSIGYSLSINGVPAKRRVFPNKPIFEMVGGPIDGPIFLDEGYQQCFLPAEYCSKPSTKFQWFHQDEIGMRWHGIADHFSMLINLTFTMSHYNCYGKCSL